MADDTRPGCILPLVVLRARRSASFVWMLSRPGWAAEFLSHYYFYSYSYSAREPDAAAEPYLIKTRRHGPGQTRLKPREFIGVSAMRRSETDRKILIQFGWFWTPVAMLATVLLVILAALAAPVVFVVTQLSLPRTVKPLRDA